MAPAQEENVPRTDTVFGVLTLVSGRALRGSGNPGYHCSSRRGIRRVLASERCDFVQGVETLFTSWAVALGIGLLIGAERERRKGQGPDRAAAGLRTFAITSLLGAVSMEVGGSALLSVASAGLLVLTALSYFRSTSEDPGLTTEIALVLTLALGGLATHRPIEAAALAVTVAVLLAARTPLHSFVRDVLTPSELKSGLIFAAATLVVWPLLPNVYLGPFNAINPRSVWSMVILIMAIGACGYVAVRALGARFGLPLAGFASGFVSSSATIAAMGARVIEAPHMLGPAVSAAVLSTVATIAQLSIVLAATSSDTLVALAMPLGFAGLAAVGYGLLFAFAAPETAPNSPASSGEAFSPRSALLFAGLLAVVLTAAAALRNWFGDSGLMAAAAVAGLADAHAAAISVVAQVASGNMPANDACVPILLGFTTNSVTKIVLAVTSGTRAFAMRVVPGLVIVLIAAWTGFLVS